MKHLVYSDNDNYPFAILVKDTAYVPHEIEQEYIIPLEKKGISRNDIIVVPLDYKNGKAPVKLIKEFLSSLIPALDAVGTKYIYCADAAYFKVLTNSRKAEPHLGYSLPCAVPDYEHFEVVLGVNHKSLIYNPANEGKMLLSLSTLVDVFTGQYQGLGENIIHSASYPKTTEDIAAALDDLLQYPELSADIETFSLDFDKAGIGSICFNWDEHNGIAFPVDYVSLEGGTNDEGHYGKQIDNREVKYLLKTFFEQYKGELNWHRANFDLGVLIYELFMDDLLDNEGLLTGLEVMCKKFHDTRIIAYLATNTTAGNNLSLKELAHEFAGNWAMGDDIKDIRKIPLDMLLRYNLVDGLSTTYTKKKYWPIMVADNQLDIYENLMMPSQMNIIQVELSGMPLDPEGVQHAKKELQNIVDGHMAVFHNSKIIQDFNKRIQEEAMLKHNAKLKKTVHPIDRWSDPTSKHYVEFNPNSDDQLRKLLFEDLALPILNTTQGNQASTNGDTLKALTNHTADPTILELIENLLGYSDAQKILSAFIPAFEQAIAKDDSGIVWLHGNFNLGGTKSGRLSSSDPNLQQIPSNSTHAKLIKMCFKAPEGWIFCGADFNSLEDYISALQTKDPNKLKIYERGFDGHSVRAVSYWPEEFPDIDPEDPEQVNSLKRDDHPLRQKSKGPTFQLTYHGTWMGLMKDQGFSRDEAKAIEANYHEMYKVSDEWVEARLQEARDQGYVELAFGLRLRTPLLAQTIEGHSANPREAEGEKRTAGNALGQSWGLLNNRALNAFMAVVRKSKYRNDIKPIAMIHDAIYLVIRDNSKVVEFVNRELIKAMSWQEHPVIQHDTVKLGAGLDIFWPNWAHACELPNNASEADIVQQISDYVSDFKEAA